MPRKTFTAGEVLTAANVNEYLMDQTVMVFDDSAARGSAIGTAIEGMITYLKDTDITYYYDGSAWQTLGIDPVTLTSSTAVAYTVLTADAGSYLRFTDAATITVSTATAFTAGQQVQILADGTALSITTDGATLGGAGTAFTSGTFTVGNQYQAVSVFCVDTDTYRVIGNVSAV